MYLFFILKCYLKNHYFYYIKWHVFYVFDRLRVSGYLSMLMVYSELYYNNNNNNIYNKLVGVKMSHMQVCRARSRYIVTKVPDLDNLGQILYCDVNHLAVSVHGYRLVL